MKLRLSDRQVALKPYYVFFAFGGRFSGCYAVVQAENREQARIIAASRYGYSEVKTVECNENYAKSKVQLFGFKKVNQ